MQNPFVSQPGLFVTTSDLEQLAPHALDATEAVLGWSKLEQSFPRFTPRKLAVQVARF